LSLYRRARQNGSRRLRFRRFAAKFGQLLQPVAPLRHTRVPTIGSVCGVGRALETLRYRLPATASSSLKFAARPCLVAIPTKTQFPARISRILFYKICIMRSTNRADQLFARPLPPRNLGPAPDPGAQRLSGVRAWLSARKVDPVSPGSPNQQAAAAPGQASGGGACPALGFSPSSFAAGPADK
jgi:hypothetical protein